MQPINYSKPFFTSSVFRAIVVIIVMAAMCLGGYQLYYSSTFHITRIDPNLSRVSEFQPYLRIYFSKPINSDSLSLSDPDSIVQSKQVNGKIVTLNFIDQLDVNKTYTLTIKKVSTTEGKQITNKQFTFIARDIPINKLSEDAQQAIVNRQDHYPYSIYSIPFNNFDELTNQGLSSTQEQSVKQAIFDYSQQSNQKFTNVTLNTNTITPGPFDPNGTNLTRTLTFSFTANSKPYNMTVRYEGLSDATISISDQSNGIVFNNTASNDTQLNPEDD